LLTELLCTGNDDENCFDVDVIKDLGDPHGPSGEGTLSNRRTRRLTRSTSTRAPAGKLWSWQALRDTGELSSFICVYRWSGPELRRQAAVKNWKRLIEIAVEMGVQVINTEFSGDPTSRRSEMFYRSMEELLPIFEREGIRVEIQAHPWDFCEENNETVDIVKSFRSDNVKYVYSVRTPSSMTKAWAMRKCCAMRKRSIVLIADTRNHTKHCRYIVNPPGVDAVTSTWASGRGCGFRRAVPARMKLPSRPSRSAVSRLWPPRCSATRKK
jgi:myo-inositol catabolism protein IolH